MTPSVETASANGSAIGFVELVQAELRRLLEQRSEVERRMRSLGCTLRGLQLGVGRRASDGMDRCRPGVSEGSLRLRGQWREQAGDRPFRLRGRRTRLARAVRIALLEAGGAASAEEIYARIVRRGSFFFGDTGVAVEEVARALEAVGRPIPR